MRLAWYVLFVLLCVVGVARAQEAPLEVTAATLADGGSLPDGGTAPDGGEIPIDQEMNMQPVDMAGGCSLVHGVADESFAMAVLGVAMLALLLRRSARR